VTLLEPVLATARSGLPSRLKSPTTTESGRVPTPTGEPAACEKPPNPFPSRIDTMFEALWSATARSGLPSRLKSPTASDLRPPPTAKGEPEGCEKPPAPSPSRIVTLFELAFVTARSGLPSRLKSQTATELGTLPTSKGEPEGCEKPP